MKKGENNIYAKINKYEILKCLSVISDEKYFKDMLNMLKEISEVECYDIDEHYTKIEKLSELVKQDKIYPLEILEKLGEENLKYMKLFLREYYKGGDKNAIDPKLKEKYSEILSNLANIIVKKYNIDEERILNNIQRIINESKLENNKNKNQIDKPNIDEAISEEDILDKLSIYILSLNEHEQLYYELLLQSILEKPDSNSKVKSWSAPIFKAIKNVLGTALGAKISSLTGSKLLTALTISAGACITIKDIADDYVKKKYFSNNNFRKLYHINQKNSMEKNITIFKRKIKESFKKIINPIKNYFSSFIEEKIFNLEEKNKIGLESNFSNIHEMYNEFKNNVIDDYLRKKKREIINNFYQSLKSIEKNKKLEMYSRDSETKTKSKNIKKFYSMKKDIIEEISKKKNEKLNKEYPEFKEQKDCSYYEAGKNKFYELKSNVKAVLLTWSETFFNVNYDKDDNEMREEMLKNIKAKKFYKEKEKINKERELNINNTIYEEIKNLSDISNYYNDQFIESEEKKNNEIVKLTELKCKLFNDYDEEIKENKEIETRNGLNLTENLIEDSVIINK